jgi:hypothetical protein
VRTYEISEEADGFEFVCRAIPPETTPWGWQDNFVIRQLTEADAHRAGVFAWTREGIPLGELYVAASLHIGRTFDD